MLLFILIIYNLEPSGEMVSCEKVIIEVISEKNDMYRGLNYIWTLIDTDASNTESLLALLDS